MGEPWHLSRTVYGHCTNRLRATAMLCSSSVVTVRGAHVKDTGLALKEPCRQGILQNILCLVKLLFDKSKSNLVNRD